MNMLLCASTSKSLLMTQLVMFMLIPDASALMFRSTAVSKQWDTWAFVENGTYYAYYLITEVSYGEGFGVATSPTGASEWTDHGYVWHGPAWNSSQYWQGTSSVWRAADFNSTGRYLINYSEMRPNNSQTITFAESFNLINWTRPAPYDLYFPINTTFYTDPGRWDTIYSVPLAPGERDGYPRLGYWTASPIGGKGTFGFGITDDGYHWTALASPVMQPEPIGAELGAVEWIPFQLGQGWWPVVCDAGVRLASHDAHVLGPDGVRSLVACSQECQSAQRLVLLLALLPRAGERAACHTPELDQQGNTRGVHCSIQIDRGG